VNKIQQKKAAGTKSGKTETSQNSFVAERQKRNPRISKNVGSNFILKDKN